MDQEPIRLGMTLKASTVFGRRMSASQVLLPIDMHDGMVSIGCLMLHSFSDDLKARCSISGHGRKRGGSVWLGEFLPRLVLTLVMLLWTSSAVPLEAGLSRHWIYCQVLLYWPPGQQTESQGIPRMGRGVSRGTGLVKSIGESYETRSDGGTAQS